MFQKLFDCIVKVVERRLEGLVIDTFEQMRPILRITLDIALANIGGRWLFLLVGRRLASLASL